MARIFLTVERQFATTNVSRFAIDPLKIIGLSESIHGHVTVSFVGANGQTASTIVEETFDEIAEAIEYADYNKLVEIGGIAVE